MLTDDRVNTKSNLTWYIKIKGDQGHMSFKNKAIIEKHIDEKCGEPRKSVSIYETEHL